MGFRSVLSPRERFILQKAPLDYTLIIKTLSGRVFLSIDQNFQVFFSTRIQFWLQIISISWVVNPAPSNKATSLG